MTIFFSAANELLADYLRYLFPPDEKGGPCKVTIVHSFGGLLVGYARSSCNPVPRPCGKTAVELELPDCPETQILENKFIHYTYGDTCRLNLALQAIFDIDFQSFYLKGEGLGFRKKDIIEVFVSSRGLASIDPYDALHKRVYRREQEKRAKVAKILLRKIYYMYESLDIDIEELKNRQCYDKDSR